MSQAPATQLDTQRIEDSNFFGDQQGVCASIDQTIPTGPDQARLRRDKSNTEYHKLLYEELPGESETPTCVENANAYRKLLHENMERFDGEFVQNELADQRTLGNVDPKIATQYIWLVRMTTAPKIHRAILRCELPRTFYKDATLRQELSLIDRRCKDLPEQPRIYANYHCRASDGESMTPRQVQKIVKLMRRYVTDDGFAKEIDAQKGRRMAPV